MTVYIVVSCIHQHLIHPIDVLYNFLCYHCTSFSLYLYVEDLKFSFSLYLTDMTMHANK